MDDIEEVEYPNLVRLKKAGDAYSDNVRSLLKGSASEKRKISQRINGLKFANPKNLEKKALELASDPKLSAVAITKLASELLEMDLTPKLKLVLLGKLCQSHSTIFGNKIENTTPALDLFNQQLQSWSEKNDEIKKAEMENKQLKKELKELKNEMFLGDRDET